MQLVINLMRQKQNSNLIKILISVMECDSDIWSKNGCTLIKFEKYSLSFFLKKFLLLDWSLSFAFTYSENAELC